MSTSDISRLDEQDPLASGRQQFHLPADTIYLDGNSLGLMSYATRERVSEVTATQWGEHLITSWNRHKWIDLPQRVGNKIGRLIGAADGQVVCCDSISVNLFKVLAAALYIRPGRNQILSTVDNFPTDLYMVQGLEQLIGAGNCHLVMVEEDELETSINEKTAAVLATEVNFRTGRRLELQSLTAAAQAAGALMIADLAHSAGVMPVELDNWQVDFAIGCTYKYMNGGPGAPAFVYAAQRHHTALQQPLCGWMGHVRPFDFSPHYEAADDMSQFLSGTPPVISMSAVDAALEAFDGVSLAEVRTKSIQLSELFHSLVEQHGLSTELRLISPKDPVTRGSQLSYQHEHAYGICQALIEAGVIADFRAPDFLRFGFAPLYNSYADVWNAVELLKEVISSEAHLDRRWQERNPVT
ncbi:kynureninase [Pseudidiomarina sp.]|uniref:kynureninase n=1 Tax=Pseudidiomarina sp. TaxID=2081707 RepID=UPI00299D8185|nr:kynureninase [Pseudidiomarina sp.]MDX1705577.1 kynureninase [Pseudidiomarina sp.]